MDLLFANNTENSQSIVQAEILNHAVLTDCCKDPVCMFRGGKAWV